MGRQYLQQILLLNVKGDLTFANAGKIGLTANIDGNKFAGKAEDNGGYATEGGFYGGKAEHLGGIYESDKAQGTYGASQVTTPTPTPTPTPTNPIDPVDSNMTGVQSFTLSNKDAIGFRSFWDDKDNKGAGDKSDTFTNTRDGDNFKTFDSLTARADLTKPDTVSNSVTAKITSADDGLYANNTNGFKVYNGSTKVQVSKPISIALDLPYASVYKNFESQMQIGHIYGDAKLGTSSQARVSSVYVQGKLTGAKDMEYMKTLAQFNIDNGINDGVVKYLGNATYMDNLHFNDTGRKGPVVDGVSKFDVNFVGNSLKGELVFDSIGKNIGINANIDGNTFAGTNADNKVQTSGGFYGEDAKFLGGIYQNALQPGGSGTGTGTGTTFQGTYGAEKQ